MNLAVSISEAVKISGVGRTTLYKAIGRGALPARKVFRRTVIMVSDLEIWLKNCPATQATECDKA